MKIQNKLDKPIALGIYFGNRKEPDEGSQILKPNETTDELPEDSFIEIRELFPYELENLEE